MIHQNLPIPFSQCCHSLQVQEGISETRLDNGISPIWMILVTARKELEYYFAKTLFQTATQKEEPSEKAMYLIKATKSYEKYLRRTLGLEINNDKNIYSKSLSDPKLNENELIQKVSKSFDSNNKLEPIKTLSEIMNVKETKAFWK
jgi:hypothetical protein